MTPRERVLAAINHQEPDQVPVDLGSMRSSGISAVAYHNLNKYLNYNKSKTRIFDTVQELALPEQHILDRFGIDSIPLGRAFNMNDDYWYEFDLTPEIKAFYPSYFLPKRTGAESWEYYLDDLMIARKPKGATFFDSTHFPYQDSYPDNYNNLDAAMKTSLWASMPAAPWNFPDTPEYWKDLRAKAIELRNSSDKAIMMSAGCNLFEWGTFLRRMDNFLMDVYADPYNVEKLVDALMERHMAKLEKICTAVGDVIDIISFGDDLGMDSGPFMAPEIYRQLFKPSHTKLCDYVHKNTKMHTFLHSCGSIYQLMPDLIEAGFEIFNPVQTNAYQMEPERLKKEFGKDITFWGGGVDTRSILNNGTPQQVKDQVKERIDVLAPGGGFVFNTVHNILPDVPPENIVAMFDAIN